MGWLWITTKVKRTLNVYHHPRVATEYFDIACKNMKEGDIASHRDLTIKNEASITVFAHYTDDKSFVQKYLQGWIWDEINDCANLPYDVWLYTQSRLLERRTNENTSIQH